MLRLGMLLSCILMSNRALLDELDNEIGGSGTSGTNSGSDQSPNSTSNRPTAVPTAVPMPTTPYARLRTATHTGVTCYICVNVSDNIVCNKYAIDRPCRQGETFCHTLHVMDSKGTSVLVNKKCTTSKECRRNKVGCVKVDTQMMCVSCCDHDYCNIDVPTNYTNAIYDDRVTRAGGTGGKLRPLSAGAGSDGQVLANGPRSNGNRAVSTIDGNKYASVEMWCHLALIALISSSTYLTKSL